MQVILQIPGQHLPKFGKLHPAGQQVYTNNTNESFPY